MAATHQTAICPICGFHFEQYSNMPEPAGCPSCNGNIPTRQAAINANPQQQDEHGIFWVFQQQQVEVMKLLNNITKQLNNTTLFVIRNLGG